MMVAARRNERRATLVALLASMLVAAPVLVGIAYAAAASMGIAGAGAGTASAARLIRVLNDGQTWAGLVWSVSAAAVATVAATGGAIAVAVCFRGGGLSDRMARALAAAPLPLPHLVAAALAVWVLGQSGMLARVAFALGWIAAPSAMPPLIYDQWGVGLVLTMAWKEMAFLSVVATALLSTRTAAAEEAARTLGASEWETFHRVTFPVLWRGLVPAVVAVFIFVVGSYEAAALLAPSSPLALPLLVAERSADPDLARRGDAYVVTLLLLGMGIVAVIAHEWVRARWESLEE